REEGQITALVVHHAPTNRQCKDILAEPNAVVSHPPQEGLLWPFLAAVAGDAAAIFTTRVNGDGESNLRDPGVLRSVEVPHLDAVVRMDPRPSGNTKSIGTVSIFVEHQRQPLLGPPQDLPTQTTMTV